MVDNFTNTATFPLYLNDLKEVVKDPRIDLLYSTKKHLKGNFIKYFIDGKLTSNSFKMNNHRLRFKGLNRATKQPSDIQLQPINSVMYEEPNKVQTYIRINADCKICKKQYDEPKLHTRDICKFTFIIEQNPFSLNDSKKIDHHNKEYVDVKVRQLNDHKHDLKPEIKLNMRNEERKAIAEDMILNHRGSAKRYQLAAISRDKKSIPSLYALRKVKGEYTKSNHKIDFKVRPEEDDNLMEENDDFKDSAENEDSSNVSTNTNLSEDEQALIATQEVHEIPSKYNGAFEWLASLFSTDEALRIAIQGNS
jgi:hypothetical protein